MRSGNVSMQCVFRKGIIALGLTLPVGHTHTLSLTFHVYVLPNTPRPVYASHVRVACTRVGVSIIDMCSCTCVSGLKHKVTAWGSSEEGNGGS